MAEEKTSPPTIVDVEKDVKGHVDPKLKEHAQDADEALKAFQELHGEAIELDAATNKRLLRTIDWHMMPIMCCVYGMNYLDSTWFFDSNLEISYLTLHRNDPILRQCHGAQARSEPERRRISMAG